MARNSKSLTDAAKGAASYGAKSIIDQAEEFVRAAEQHLCMFKQPKVGNIILCFCFMNNFRTFVQIVFYFSQCIENELLEELQQVGVETASLEQPGVDLAEEQTTDMANVSTLNLDITTLLGYVSSVCNGSCNWIFQEAILTEQAEKERQTPLKPLLDKLFIGI